MVRLPLRLARAPSSVLVFGFGKNFHPILTIDEYTGFFLSIILGLGICFELPILIFFLALFGIVDAKFLLRHFRYAVLAIFLVAAIICPMPDPFSMCLFASPMLALYFLGVGVAWFVHPDHRKRKERKPHDEFVIPYRLPSSRPEQWIASSPFAQRRGPRILLLLLLALFLPTNPPARAQQPTGQAIYNLTQQFLTVAPKRFNGSPGHLAAEALHQGSLQARSRQG